MSLEAVMRGCSHASQASNAERSYQETTKGATIKVEYCIESISYDLNLRRPSQLFDSPFVNAQDVAIEDPPRRGLDQPKNGPGRREDLTRLSITLVPRCP